LIMVKNPSFNPQGDYSLSPQSIINLPQESTLTYASMGVFHPRLFDHHPGLPFDLSAVLTPAIEQGHITGELFLGQWWNVGTPELLQQLNYLLTQT
jgi:N-acetyl-alpha-D-muramate 1-phosphate uridylyltransferase